MRNLKSNSQKLKGEWWLPGADGREKWGNVIQRVHISVMQDE